MCSIDKEEMKDLYGLGLCLVWLCLPDECAPLTRSLLSLLRSADDPDARVPLGLKYGCEVAEASQLLATAKALGLSVVGVSFHVGSACKNLATFTGAIENARKIFDEANAMGFHMELMDIGGGFTGHFDEMGNVMFGEIATTINNAIAMNFPPEMGVRIIAEPGRYFAETSSSLFTPVYGQRDRKAENGSIKQKDYWLTDGLYGSFNCILYDGQNPGYEVVRSPLLPEPSAKESTMLYPSTLWGPTCDSADCVYKDHMLPQLRNGDWLMWNNAGVCACVRTPRAVFGAAQALCAILWMHSPVWSAARCKLMRCGRWPQVCACHVRLMLWWWLRPPPHV